MHEGMDDLEVQIKNKRWPKNGMGELQELVRNEALQWIEWAKTTPTALLSAREYNSFIGCLTATVYLFACNGRPMALQLLNVHQVVQCLETNISPMSSSFKTAWTYGKQV